MENIVKHIEKPTIFVEYKIDYSKQLHSESFNNFSVKRFDSGKYNQNIIISLYR